ncbi:unnamed protein product, partial [Rotaria sordida]
MYQLYLCYQTKRLILELKCNTIDRRFFSAKCLSKYPTNYTHIDRHAPNPNPIKPKSNFLFG